MFSRNPMNHGAKELQGKSWLVQSALFLKRSLIKTSEGNLQLYFPVFVVRGTFINVSRMFKLQVHEGKDRKSKWRKIYSFS